MKPFRPITDPTDRDVAMVLGHHEGRALAIHAPDLAAAVGISERAVRDSVSRLVKEHGRRIGSHPTVGYFMIMDGADRDLALGQIDSRIKDLAVRAAVLRGLTSPGQAVQLALDFERVGT